MSTKLTGFIELSMIPKNIIKQMQNGAKGVYIDVVQKREPSAKGFTHYVSVYDSENRQTLYIGNLKPVEFGLQDAGQMQGQPAAKEPLPVGKYGNYPEYLKERHEEQVAQENGNDDLPF